jgi:hypothetical protein
MGGPQNQSGRFGEEKNTLAPIGIGTSDPPSLYTHHYAKPAPSRLLIGPLTFPVQLCVYIPHIVTITNMHAHTVFFFWGGGFAGFSRSAMINSLSDIH